MGKIFLEGIRIYAYHGCFKEEAAIGTNFLLNIEIETDHSKASISDDISDTVNYQTVFQIVKEQMNIRSNLLENVSLRILDALLSSFPTVQWVGLKLSKLNVPLGGHVDSVSVWIEKSRDEI